MELARKQLLLDASEISQEFPCGYCALTVHGCNVW
jgi:hypothetical protein